MTGRWVPRQAVLTPFAAAWLARRVSPDEWAAGVQWALSIGQPGLAAELHAARAQVDAARDDWLARQAGGGDGDAGSLERTSEPVDPAAGGESERPPPSRLDSRAAATRLGVTQRQVQKLCDAGVLVADRVGRTYVIDEVSVADYQDLRRST